MKTWIKKYWRWLVGAPIVLAVISFLSRIFRPAPPSVPVVTKEQYEKEIEKIEKKKNEDLKRIENEEDEELKRVLKKFGMD
jgi:hypothetical protein